MHHTVDGVPVFGDDKIYHPEYNTEFTVDQVLLLSSIRVSECYSTEALAEQARNE